jgi:PAS domain S-box-containing protein
MQPELKSEKTPYHLIIIFLMLSITIWTGGFFYYMHEKERITKQEQKELTAIADLKVKQITDWRNERLGDATQIFSNHLIINEIQKWLRNPSLSIYKREILEWLTSIQKFYGYQNILLIDAKGNIRLSVRDEKDLLGLEARRLSAKTIKDRKIIFSDLYRSTVSNVIRLGLFVPIIPLDKERIPVGLIVLRIDPYKFLYPLIQLWPTPTKTAETLLVRREGNDVVFLNELRYKKDTALSLKISMSEKHLPAVVATQGYQGTFEGKDYRGVPVLSVLRTIPDTTWFLVAKVDAEEIYTPIREQFWVIALIVTLLIFSSGTGIGFIYRHQQAEFYRRQYEMEHRHSALLERFEYLTRHANDIILLADDNYKIVEANERAMQSYGYDRDELLQLQLTDLRTAKAGELFDAQMEEVKTRNGFVFETQHQRKDGTTFPIEVSSRVIAVEGKKFYQYIIRDISERKQAEEALRKAHDELGTRVEERTAELTTVNKELEAFSYSVSHDLRAPLRHIVGFVNLLEQEKRPMLDKEGIAYMDTISRSAKRMGDLIDDLLAFSRMGRFEMKKTEVNTKELVEEVIRELEGETQARNIQWIIGELPEAYGDPQMLRLVFINLISNALKFTRNREQANIEVGCYQENPPSPPFDKGGKEGFIDKDKEIVFYVKDDGVGFDMQYVDKLFGVFQRLHRVEEFEGTGVGLANVRRIIHRHGGKTWAEGSVGNGATFYFSLPKERRANV